MGKVVFQKMILTKIAMILEATAVGMTIIVNLHRLQAARTDRIHMQKAQGNQENPLIQAIALMDRLTLMDRLARMEVDPALIQVRLLEHLDLYLLNLLALLAHCRLATLNRLALLAR